jgi:hypothetical protein
MFMWPMIPNPHDLLFKAVFGQAEHARGTLRAIAPPKEAIVTYGQQLREQGRQQGVEQGRQRSQELLRRMLRQRFGDNLDARSEQRIEAATIEELEDWSVRVLSAGSLAELFAG